MLENLDFIIGERDSLRGRAIVYCENATGSENPFNPHYPALAVAADPGELFGLLSTITPLPEQMRDTFLERIRQFSEMWSRTMFGHAMFQHAREMIDNGLEQMGLSEELKEQLRQELEQIPEENTGVPFHGCFLPLIGFDPQVIEPYSQDCDVVRAEEVPSISYAGLVLSGHAQHYLASYLLQNEEAAQESERAAGRELPQAQVLPPAEFLALLNRKVSEMMYARETGAPLDPHIRELMQVARGTVFMRDVLNLANFAGTTHPERIAIIDLYLRRVTLLVQERYEEIPAIDQSIQELVAAGE